MKELERRITELEHVGASNGPATSGVVIMKPGESAEEAIARVGPGNWLMVPGVMKNAEAWQAMMRGKGADCLTSK